MNLVKHQMERHVLTELLEAKRMLGQKIRNFAKWDTMNLESVFQVREFLFGEAYNGKKRENPHLPVRLRPPGAKSLYLTPVLSTDKRPMKWADVMHEGLDDQKSPSTSKMSLAILGQDNCAVKRHNARLGRDVVYDLSKPVSWIRDYRFVAQVLKSVLRTPEKDDEDNFVTASDGDGGGDFYVYPGGLPRAICSDGRVRTRIWPTKETRRWSTVAPPTQNFAKRREAQYQEILGPLYRWPLRSIICASPGYVLMEADYLGAELLGAGIMSGDKNLIDHALRASLPEDDPSFYDIHSNVTVNAFRLECAPTKAGLKSVGKVHLRVAAKNMSMTPNSSGLVGHNDDGASNQASQGL